MTTITAQEKAFRQFLRANFRARFVRDENKDALTSLKGKTGKAQIQNFDTVMNALYESAKVLKETANGATFAFGKGKEKSEITLAVVGGVNMLTMKAS